MTESYHTTGRKSTHGFVYLIKSDSGHYKIGKSKNPKARAGEFSLQLPFKITVIDVIECEDYSSTERLLHRMFRRYHVNGEWFSLPNNADSILRFFKMLFSSNPVEAWFVNDWLNLPQDDLDHMGEDFTRFLPSQEVAK